MSLRIDLDFHHGLTECELQDSDDGALALGLTRGNEKVVIHMSVASVNALWLLLTRELARRNRNGGGGPE